MALYEYKVIPAPVHGRSGKGIKGSDGRFANALSEAINEQARRGWEYVRAESLPSQDRKGVTRKRVETFQNVLVFRKEADFEEEIQEGETQDKAGFNPFKRLKAKGFATASSAPEVRLTEEAPEDETLLVTTDEEIETVQEAVEDQDQDDKSKTKAKKAKPTG